MTPQDHASFTAELTSKLSAIQAEFELEKSKDTEDGEQTTRTNVDDFWNGLREQAQTIIKELLDLRNEAKEYRDEADKYRDEAKEYRDEADKYRDELEQLRHI